MSRGRVFITALMGLLLVVGLPASVSYADLYPFVIFTDNGQYSDGTGVNIYMDVNNGANVADFTFYNDSAVDCSITKIYFDDGTLLGVDSVENSPGTLFDRATGGPGNLPGASLLVPPFVADREFNIGADSPPYHNGVNNPPPAEWVKVSFVLSGTLEQLLGELNDATLRVGIHVQGFSDGSSESAINVPEPATILLLGIGTLALLKKRRM